MTVLGKIDAWWQARRPVSRGAFHSHTAKVWVKLYELEIRMSEVDSALVELNDATNEVASELDALEAIVAGSDAETAGKIRAAAERLRGLAADPANPVPDVPADGGDGSTPVPAPVEGE